VNDEKEQIQILQTALYTIAGPHVSSDDTEEAVCVYCNTPFPCFTVRVARRASADWYNGS
jgi:hypothetical protein